MYRKILPDTKVEEIFLPLNVIANIITNEQKLVNRVHIKMYTRTVRSEHTDFFSSLLETKEKTIETIMIYIVLI